MEDEDDCVEWLRQASQHVALVANELISLGDPSRRAPWRHLLPSEEPAAKARWGARAPRTRERKASASPTTPMDFSSCASGSAGDEGSCAAAAIWQSDDGIVAVRFDDLGTKVQRAPEALAARPARQPGKKKTISELREEEMSLLEERLALQKEREAIREACQALMEENQRLKRLKWTLKLDRPTSTTPPVPEILQKCCNFVLLPDLNELPLDGFD